MDSTLLNLYLSDFDTWRGIRKPSNTWDRSQALFHELLAENPQFDHSDWPLSRLLRGLERAPIDTKDAELELLATLGRLTIEAGIISQEYQASKTFPQGLENAVHVIRQVALLSLRYWKLVDSQAEVERKAAKAVRKKIAEGGGKARSEKREPLRRRVEKLALPGLKRSAKQKFKYGRWGTHFEIGNDIHDLLSDQEQLKVQPTTIVEWLKQAFPELLSSNRKK